MMAGGEFTTDIHDAHGAAVGSHISMRGNVLGVRLDVDEVVIERDPPTHKAWATVGTPELFVIGHYEMAFDIEPAPEGSVFRISIRYALPERNKWIGMLLGNSYARWCVRQVTGDVQRHFTAS
jgi:hypothetical protein